MSKHIPLTFQHQLSQTLQKLRFENGYETVHELSRAAHISPIEIMKIETGDMLNLPLLFKLAAFYNKQIKLEIYD